MIPDTWAHSTRLGRLLNERSLTDAGGTCSGETSYEDGNERDRCGGPGNGPDRLGKYHVPRSVGALSTLANSSAWECTPNFR